MEVVNVQNLISQTPLPWQTMQWKQLQNCIKQNRLPHALLFAGMQGVGKLALAYRLAQVLLCEHASDSISACQQCKSCQLFNAHCMHTGSHPDFVSITPEEEAKLIKIEQIRGLIEMTNQTPALARHKVIVIYPAENMNTASSNALLKSLEEPQKGTQFILISHQPTQLLATIRSRCQHIQFHLPSYASAKIWLSQQLGSKVDVGTLLTLTSGAPLAALQAHAGDTLERYQTFQQDVLELRQSQSDFMPKMKKWHTADIGQLCDWGLLLIHANLSKEKQPQNPNKLFQVIDFIYTIKRMLANKINMNPALVIENLFYKLKIVES